MTSAAQQSSMPVIGYVGAQSAELWASRVLAFRRGLSETGFVEGQNVTIEYRWAEDHYDRYPALIADLVRRKVAVIAIPGSTPAIVAAKASTTTIPIVFLTAADPVQTGLVASLNRPGGNLTGVTALSLELSSKQLELLHEFAPSVGAMALLVNPTNAVLAEIQSKDLPATARKLGLDLHILRATAEGEFEDVFATIVKLGIGGLVIGGESLFTSGSKKLAGLALQYRVPAIYQFREFAAAGGLMSYGTSLSDAHRLTGVYAGRILKGAKPADLPVPVENSDSTILMMQPAKNRVGGNAAVKLNCTRDWSILIQ
jgi:putative ABC transport system substrate-binding protein